MFVMVAGRQQGKSVTAVRWLLEQPRERVLLTSGEDRRKHLLRMTHPLSGGAGPRDFYEFIRSRIIVVGEYDYAPHRYAASEIGIDDAEEVFRILLGAPIEFITMNGTLVPSFHDAKLHKYDFNGVTVEPDAIDGRRAIRGRPIRDNPQA